jgi:hypothetical protein
LFRIIKTGGEEYRFSSGLYERKSPSHAKKSVERSGCGNEMGKVKICQISRNF